MVALWVCLAAAVAPYEPFAAESYHRYDYDADAINRESYQAVADLVASRGLGHVRYQDNGGYSLSAPGTPEGRELFADASAAWHQSREDWLTEHRLRWSDGAIARDYATISSENAPLLAGFAQGLDAAPRNERAFAELALSFVQRIPYDAPRSTHFRSPLSVLQENRGDCDEKSALYLALLRAMYPKLGLAVVNIPDHTYVLVGVEPRPGDTWIEVREGVRYTVAEPTGPAILQLGTLDDDNWAPGEFDLVPLGR